MAYENILTALKAYDADDGIGCVVVTGGEKAFAAGADRRDGSHPTS